MIELEIQTLSEGRDGLLMDVGRFVLANGFTLQRQRLMQGDHGVLMSMVVRGPARKQRALEAALDGYERIISFKLLPVVGAAPNPHFAVSARIVRSAVDAPPPTDRPAASIAAPSVLGHAAPPAAPAETGAAPLAPHPEPTPETPTEPAFEFVLPSPPAQPPAPAREPEQPFVERTPMGPDVAAVAHALVRLKSDYPLIFPPLRTLELTVVEAARESSLQLAGQQTGAWVFEHHYAHSTALRLPEAIERIGVPAVAALAEIEHKSGQLHIRNSPLCAQQGHSSCIFFSGYLEGLLGPALATRNLSIFTVCCRSYGADACVLAISD
jgi:hypothetical protein